MAPDVEEFGRRWEEIPEDVRRAAERDPHLRAVLRVHAAAETWDLRAALAQAVTVLVDARQDDLERWARHLLGVRPGGHA